MDRAQFMKQLEKLLSDISESERQEALAYYNGYFDDAGSENEAAVIRELGSPGKVAAIIKADLDESTDSYDRYRKDEYEDSEKYRNNEKYENNEKYGNSDEYEDSAEYENSGKSSDYQSSGKIDLRKKESTKNGYHPKEKRMNSRLILILIAVVFLSPFLAGAAGGVLGILVTLILLPFLIIFGAGVLAFGLVAGAIACIAVGIGFLASDVAIALLVTGIGGILMAAGILCGLLVIWLFSKILPWVLRKVTDFFQRILYRKKEETGV